MLYFLNFKNTDLLFLFLTFYTVFFFFFSNFIYNDITNFDISAQLFFIKHSKIITNFFFFFNLLNFSGILPLNFFFFKIGFFSFILTKTQTVLGVLVLFLFLILWYSVFLYLKNSSSIKKHNTCLSKYAFYKNTYLSISIVVFSLLNVFFFINLLIKCYISYFSSF